MKYLVLLALLAVSACDTMGMGAKDTQAQMTNDDAGSADDGAPDTSGELQN